MMSFPCAPTFGLMRILLPRRRVTSSSIGSMDEIASRDAAVSPAVICRTAPDFQQSRS